MDKKTPQPMTLYFKHTVDGSMSSQKAAEFYQGLKEAGIPLEKADEHLKDFNLHLIGIA